MFTDNWAPCSGSWPTMRWIRTTLPDQPQALYQVWNTRRSASRYSTEIPSVPVTPFPQLGQKRVRSARWPARSGSHQWTPETRSRVRVLRAAQWRPTCLAPSRVTSLQTRVVAFPGQGGVLPGSGSAERGLSRDPDKCHRCRLSSPHGQSGSSSPALGPRSSPVRAVGRWDRVGRLRPMAARAPGRFSGPVLHVASLRGCSFLFPHTAGSLCGVVPALRRVNA